MSIVGSIMAVLWCFNAVYLLFGARCADCHLLVPLRPAKRTRWTRVLYRGRSSGWLCCTYDRAREHQKTDGGR